VKVGIIPENLVERVVLALGLVPAPAIEARFSFMMSRAIMAGTKLGVFEALAAGPLTGDEVAGRCGTDRRATGKLLNALIGAGCVRFEGGRYELSRLRGRAWWQAARTPRKALLFRPRPPPGRESVVCPRLEAAAPLAGDPRPRGRRDLGVGVLPISRPTARPKAAVSRRRPREFPRLPRVMTAARHQ
jgi:hypothetical protein